MFVGQYNDEDVLTSLNYTCRSVLYKYTYTTIVSFVATVQHFRKTREVNNRKRIIMIISS